MADLRNSIRSAIWRHTACSDTFAIEATDAVLEAIEAVGFVIAPVEPDSKMVKAAGLGWSISPRPLRKRLEAYAAMIAARPKVAP